MHFPLPEFTNDTAENRLKQTFFIVEATSNEQHMLWEQLSSDSIYKILDRDGKPAYPQVKWEQISMGFGVTVGEVYKHPVFISLNWARINGKFVMFYHPTSQLIDYRKIDKWLEENFKGTYDNGTRRASTDVSNFAHCLNAIKEANKVKE